jgi:hypothetical protein
MEITGTTRFGPPGNGGKGNILLRFDCNLSLDVHDPEMRERHVAYDSDFLYRYFGLSEEQRERIQQESEKVRE